MAPGRRLSCARTHGSPSDTRKRERHGHHDRARNPRLHRRQHEARADEEQRAPLHRPSGPGPLRAPRAGRVPAAGERLLQHRPARRPRAEVLRALQAGRPVHRERRDRPFTYTNRNGEEISGEEFRVTSIGHDPARTNYEVDRTPRNPPRGVDQEAPSQNLEHGDGLSEAPDSPEQSTEPESPTPTTEAMDGATPEEPEPAPAPALPEPAAAAVEADAATEGRGRRLAQIFGGGVSNRPTPVAATHDLSR